MTPEERDEFLRSVMQHAQELAAQAARYAQGDQPLSDWEIVENLNNLKLEVLERVRTDWPGTGFDHVQSMTCSAVTDARWMLPKWDVQLAQILASKGVMLEG